MTDDELIAQYIAEKGVTKCPTRIAGSPAHEGVYDTDVVAEEASDPSLAFHNAVILSEGGVWKSARPGSLRD